MYIPRSFLQEDVAALRRLILEQPLATLVIATGEGPSAEHIPMLLRETQGGGAVLCGHIARANPLAEALRHPHPALAIFTGAQSYISPAWYPAKAEHGKVVPTWNYTAVHARGNLELVDDPAWLSALLRDLSAQQEAGTAQPWSPDDAPAEFIERLSAAIVGIEMPVETLQGKWKCSQNQSRAARDGVVWGLRERAGVFDLQMAELVDA